MGLDSDGNEQYLSSRKGQILKGYMSTLVDTRDYSTFRGKGNMAKWVKAVVAADPANGEESKHTNRSAPILESVNGARASGFGILIPNTTNCTLNSDLIANSPGLRESTSSISGIGFHAESVPTPARDDIGTAANNVDGETLNLAVQTTPFQCDICIKSCKNAGGLGSHLRTHAPPI